MRRLVVTGMLVAGVTCGVTGPLAGRAAAQAQAALRRFTAPEVRDEAALARLLEALREVPGAGQAQGRLQTAGGALLQVAGEAVAEALIRAAKEAGFDLKPAVENLAGRAFFSVAGVSIPEDEEKLRQAVARVEGIGEFRILRAPRGTLLGVQGGTAKPDTVIAAARAAGFDLRPVEGPFRPGTGEGERNAPAAFGERVGQDLTKAGEAAPEFTLITKDGEGRISLADFKGKKPVVLIFGSYT